MNTVIGSVAKIGNIMNSFNIKVQNDKVLNVADTMCYILDGMANNKDIFLFIDESPDLGHVMLGEETLIGLLEKLCKTFDHDPVRVSIEIENLVQPACWPNITRCYRSSDVFYGQDIDFNIEKKLKYKTSLFVGGSRWPRLSLGSYLYNKYRNDSLITYWQNLKDTSQPCYLYLDELFKNHMLKGLDYNFIDRVKDFIKALPLHLQANDREKNNNGGYIDFTEAYKLIPQYNQVFCDVVCETVHNGQTFAFTEKIARCWMTKTPFLVFGAKGYLRNLRKLGFRTFESFWEENYDRYDNATRILLLQRQIDHIHHMDYNRLEKIYHSTEMQTILDNNYRVFKNLDREKILKAFDIT